MAVVNTTQKEFELPASQRYYARIIDVIEYEQDIPKYNKTNVPHLTIVWVLNASDSEGRPFRVTLNMTRTSIHEKTTLYKVASAILGTAPPVPFDTESLLGIPSLLMVQQEKAQNGRVYANVKIIMPVTPTEMQYIPSVPAGFVRDKDKAVADQKRSKIKQNAQQSNRSFAAPAASQAAPVPAQPVVAAVAAQPVYTPPQAAVAVSTAAPVPVPQAEVKF
jgi:hypothetical protein